MVTGELKNKVDKLWEMFWAGCLVETLGTSSLKNWTKV